MGNHVIYDALWESDKLAKCSREAALAYPWIFLVADDHGRFEYNPRKVWKHAFGYRDDISVESVAGWLDEYWRVGLLIRYHIDGDLAYWYKFRGRKPSERRPSEYPDPTQFDALAYSPRRRGDEGATTSREGGDVAATKGRRGGGKPAPEIEQSRDRAEIETEQKLSAAPTGETKTTWTAEAAALWSKHQGKAEHGKLGAILKPLVDEHGWPQVKPVWERYVAGDCGVAKRYCSAKNFAEKYLTWRGNLPPPPAEPRPAPWEGAF